MKRNRVGYLTTVVLLVAITGFVVGISAIIVEVSEAQDGGIVLDRVRRADAARLTGLAEFYGVIGSARGRQAEAARLTALAEHGFRDGIAECGIEALSRAQKADAARLTGLAEHYAPVRTERMPVMDRGRIAYASRLSGLASRASGYLHPPSPALVCLVAP